MAPVATISIDLLHTMIAEFLDTGHSMRAVLERHGVPYSSLWAFINKTHPELRNVLKDAQAARAHQLADTLLEVAENASDHQRARVIAEMTIKLIGKLAPQDFGDRIDVNMQVQTLDIAEATQRAVTYRPLRDLGAAPKPQVIDVASTPVLNAPDLKSDDDIDPFS